MISLDDLRIKNAKACSGSEFLFEAGMFPGALTQMVEFCPADLRMPLDNYFLQAGRAGEKCAFNANAITGNSPDGEGGVVAAGPLADNGATEFLDTLGVAFLNADMDIDQVTGM